MYKLHFAIFIMSLTPVIAKLASGVPILSIKFGFLYGLMLTMFLFYAFIWQKILSKIDLSIAYSFKSISIVWGMLWAIFIFNEKISMSNGLGAALVVAGVLLVGKE